MGLNHSLAKADIASLLTKEKINFKVLGASKEVLLISSETTINPEDFINSSGGTVKIIKITDEFLTKDFPENFLEKLSKDFFNQKLKFGVSIYHLGGKIKKIGKILGSAYFLARKIKKTLAKNRTKSAFLKNKHRFLSSAAVQKGIFSENGVEFAFLVSEEKVFTGITSVIQDFESYSFRDWNRPAKPTGSGMLPPKLAKTLINLAGKDNESVILDPFCGSGTIVQELILNGYKNIIAGDISEKAISSAKQNINWLRKKYPNYTVDVKFFQGDARQLSKIFPKNSIDAIVTEPFLGSPKTKHFSEKDFKEQIFNLERLYLSSFNEFIKVLKRDGIVTIIFPVFKKGNHLFFLEILEQIKKIGFRQKSFLPEFVDAKLINLNLTERNSILYYREDQTILREILIFAL